MGEAQGFILSLYMAPKDIHAVFLLDSKIVLLQVLAYF
jgi:phosphatidylserine decarboxylase